ncbi:MAG: hypothetical protein NTY15_06560 [Planctomycetota bacterium]|nr:hypothetical protein [Planctomycetota bacterium]
MKSLSLLAVVAAIGFATLTQTNLALGQTEREIGKKGNSGKEISVTESFEPTFRIEPLTQSLTGRTGAIVPFEFTLEAANRNAEIEVLPIGLRQEISGMILHDSQAPQADLLRLTSPSKMTLTSNTPAKIQGLVQFPRGDAKFHSVGILVKDVGAAAKLTANTDPSKPKTQAAIRFITQYVLRIDLEVDNVRGENANVLAIEKIELAPFDGRPKLMAQIINPSDSTFEFEVRAKLRSSPSDRTARAIRLVMPSRESIQNEGRFVGRILPKSRIRMVELLPEAIASGAYETDLEILEVSKEKKEAGKVVAKKTLSVEVNAEDFPAQEVLIAQLGEDVQVSPAQMELSQLRGGNRRMTMLVKNNGKDSKTVEVTALNSTGLTMEAVMIQPPNFTLPPNGSRKISVTLKSQDDATNATLYGALHVQCRSDRKDFNEYRDIPMAIALKKSPLPEIDMTPVQWIATGKYPCFRCTVSNSGETHHPLEARLSIFDESGNRILIPAGFGKWLMPGQISKLEFRSEHVLSPGKYKLKCELQHGDGSIVKEQVFEVSDLDNAKPIKSVSAEGSGNDSIKSMKMN